MIPNYMQIIGACRSFGARIVPFPLVEEDGWRPDLDALEAAVSERTRMIAICNPNNPSGAVLTEPEMDRIVEVAERCGAWLLADEVYRGAELSGEECPTFWGRTEKVLLNAGLSKAFGLPGLRVGWTVTTEEKGDRALGPPRLQQPRGERAGRPASADRARQAAGHPRADPGHHPAATPAGGGLGGVP